MTIERNLDLDKTLVTERRHLPISATRDCQCQCVHFPRTIYSSQGQLIFFFTAASSKEKSYLAIPLDRAYKSELICDVQEAIL